MARTVNPEEHAARRNQILDVAQRLVYSKGYERMTIQDILSDLGMSSGAFYHYFPTKPAVLEALIERMQREAEQHLVPIVHDPHLSALEKLQRFFATLEQSSMTQSSFVADLLRVWFADENAIVREKIYDAMLERRAPLLTEIVRQGLQEGVFTTAYPGPVGEIILFLARGMGTAVAKLMLSFERDGNEPRFIEDVITTFAACVDAVERVLGAPSGSLYRFDTQAAKTWAAMLRNRSNQEGM